jgi:hypothetical protein
MEEGKRCGPNKLSQTLFFFHASPSLENYACLSEAFLNSAPLLSKPVLPFSVAFGLAVK